uniref:Uncharacterized protein n=1 Tax=Calidris pygmaea TaxID=425635 RepID=A0A8C3JD11_9CHAR
MGVPDSGKHHAWQFGVRYRNFAASQCLERRNPGPKSPGVMLPSAGAEICWPQPKGWQALPATSPAGRGGCSGAAAQQGWGRSWPGWEKGAGREQKGAGMEEKGLKRWRLGWRSRVGRAERRDGGVRSKEMRWRSRVLR